MPRFLEIANWSPGYINVAPQHMVIMAECMACGETRQFLKSSLPESLRHALIREIEERLKCCSCGAKAGKLRFGSFKSEE